MQVIDLIKKFYNNEHDIPDKMIINKRQFHSNVFKNMVYEGDCNTDIWMALKLQHIDLDDYVKTIEEETIDIDNIQELLIEQLKEREHTNADIYVLAQQQNNLLQAIKQLNREIKELKENN